MSDYDSDDDAVSLGPDEMMLLDEEDCAYLNIQGKEKASDLKKAENKKATEKDDNSKKIESTKSINENRDKRKPETKVTKISAGAKLESKRSEDSKEKPSMHMYSQERSQSSFTGDKRGKNSTNSSSSVSQKKQGLVQTEKKCGSQKTHEPTKSNSKANSSHSIVNQGNCEDLRSGTKVTSSQSGVIIQKKPVLLKRNNSATDRKSMDKELKMENNVKTRRDDTSSSKQTSCVGKTITSITSSKSERYSNEKPSSKGHRTIPTISKDPVIRTSKPDKGNVAPRDTLRQLILSASNSCGDVSAPVDGNFSSIVILANSLYGRKLRILESNKVRLILVEDLNLSTLLEVVQKNKDSVERNSLWILISGIYSIANEKIHNICDYSRGIDKSNRLNSCRSNPLYRIELQKEYASTDFEEVTSKRLEMLDSCWEDIQEALGTTGVFASVPPMPAAVISTRNRVHEELHDFISDYGWIATHSERENIYKTYPLFCDSWTSLTLKKVEKWMDPSEVYIFKMQSLWSSLGSFTLVNQWIKSLRVFCDWILAKPFPKDMVSKTTPLFERVVVIGHTKYNLLLQNLARDLPISFVEETLDFNENGVRVFQQLKKDYPEKTLWCIMAGVSELATPFDGMSGKCQDSRCRDPFPVFVGKNHKHGHSDFANMVDSQMINVVVESSFDFAKKASQVTDSNSAIFMTPIIPQLGFSASYHATQSHKTLHGLYRDFPHTPFFIVAEKRWLSCTSEFEETWLWKMAESFPEGSVPYNLIREYDENKQKVFVFGNGNKNLKVLPNRKVWSHFMFDMIKYFLSLKKEIQNPTSRTASSYEIQRLESVNREGSVESAEGRPSQQKSRKESLSPTRSLSPRSVISPQDDRSQSRSSASSSPFVPPPQQTESPTINPLTTSAVVVPQYHNPPPPVMTSVAPSTYMKPQQQYPTEPSVVTSVPTSTFIPLEHRNPADVQTTTSVAPSTYMLPQKYLTEPPPPITSCLAPPTIMAPQHKNVEASMMTPPVSMPPPHKETLNPSDEMTPMQRLLATAFSDASLTPINFPPPVLDQSMTATAYPGKIPGLQCHSDPFTPSSVPMSVPPPQIHTSHAAYPRVSLPSTLGTVPQPVPKPSYSVAPYHSIAPATYTTASLVNTSVPPSVNFAAVAELSRELASESSTPTPPPASAPSPAPVQKGHVMIQKIQTNMNEDDVKELLEAFGKLENLEWPSSKAGSPGEFMMLTYDNETDAERCVRILNFLRVFGDESEVKLFGNKNAMAKLESTDMDHLMKIHGIFDDIKKKVKGRVTVKEVKKEAPASTSISIDPVMKQETFDLDSKSDVTPKKEPGKNAPSLKKEPGRNAPSLKKESGRIAPSPKKEPGRNDPSLKKEPGRNDPSPKKEPEKSAPSSYNISEVPLPDSKPVFKPLTFIPFKIEDVPLPKTKRAKSPEPFQVVVKFQSRLIPLKDLDKLFLELGATKAGVVREDDLIHYSFKEFLPELKLLNDTRLPDGKLKLFVDGPNTEPEFMKGELDTASDKLNALLSKTLAPVCERLKRSIQDEVNYYTFKTEPCDLDEDCPDIEFCQGYHSVKDKRRCPSDYKYSSEECSYYDTRDICIDKDLCPKAHTQVEKLLHSKNFKMSLCSSARQNMPCSTVKGGKMCYAAHKGEPDMFYHLDWENLYVEGLQKSLDYLCGAIRNLYKFPDLKCPRVLFITPSERLAKLYLDLVADLVSSCGQKVALLQRYSRSIDATIIIAAMNTIMPMLPLPMDKVLNKKIDLNRLKALIIDDGPTVFQSIPETKQNVFHDFGRKWQELNFVVIAESVDSTKSENAKELLGLRNKLKLVSIGSSKDEEKSSKSSAADGVSLSGTEGTNESVSRNESPNSLSPPRKARRGSPSPPRKTVRGSPSPPRKTTRGSPLGRHSPSPKKKSRSPSVPRKGLKRNTDSCRSLSPARKRLQRSPDSHRSPSPNRRKLKRSPDTRRSLSSPRSPSRKFKRSPDNRRSPSPRRRGHRRSPFNRRSPSPFRKGQKRSPDTRRSPSPFKRGLRRSTDTRRSPSPLKRGLRRSPDSLRSLSPSRRGPKRSPDSRRSPSPYRRGTRRSPGVGRSISPRRKSRSPGTRLSPLPYKRASRRSPVRRRSPSPTLRGMRRSPISRRSPSPLTKTQRDFSGGARNYPYAFQSDLASHSSAFSDRTKADSRTSYSSYYPSRNVYGADRRSSIDDKGDIREEFGRIDRHKDELEKWRRPQDQMVTDESWEEDDLKRNDSPEVKANTIKEKENAVLKAKEELKLEYEQELELYTTTPEFHPMYEDKYSYFIEQYNRDFPGRNDISHSDKLWTVFWKMTLEEHLTKEYKTKLEDLEAILLRIKQDSTSKSFGKSLMRNPSPTGFREREARLDYDVGHLARNSSPRRFDDFDRNQERTVGSRSPGRDKDFMKNPSPGRSRDFMKNPSPGSGRDFMKNPSPDGGFAGRDRDFMSNPSPARSREFMNNPSPGRSREFMNNPSPGRSREFMNNPSPGRSRDFMSNPSPGRSRDFMSNLSPGRSRDFMSNPFPERGRDFTKNLSPDGGFPNMLKKGVRDSSPEVQRPSSQMDLGLYDEVGEELDLQDLMKLHAPAKDSGKSVYEPERVWSSESSRGSHSRSHSRSSHSREDKRIDKDLDLHPRVNDNQLPSQGQTMDFPLKEIIGLLSEVGPALGLLSPVSQTLVERMNACGSDESKLCQVLEDSDTEMGIKLVAEGFEKLSLKPGPNVEKFKEAHFKTLKLLDYPKLMSQKRCSNQVENSIAVEHTPSVAPQGSTSSELQEPPMEKDIILPDLTCLSEGLGLLEDLAPYFDSLGSQTVNIVQKLQSSLSNTEEVCRLLQIDSNVILLKQIANKSEFLGNNTQDSVAAQKYQVASLLASKLLEIPSTISVENLRHSAVKESSSVPSNPPSPPALAGENPEPTTKFKNMMCRSVPDSIISERSMSSPYKYSPNVAGPSSLSSPHSQSLVRGMRSSPSIASGSGDSTEMDSSFSSLKDVCPLLGVLGPAALMLVENLSNVWPDKQKISQALSDENNVTLLNLIKENLRRLSEKPSSESERQTYHKAMTEVSKLLSAKETTSSSEKYLGLDIKEVAEMTYNKSQSFTIQYIKSALFLEGVNASNEDITNICKLLSKYHCEMAIGASHQGVDSELKALQSYLK